MQSELNTDYAGTQTLWFAEKNLRNYNQDLIEKLMRPKKDAKDVLEFGAGIGTLAILWEQATGTKPECVEIDAGQRAVIETRELHCYDSLEAISKQFDVIYTSNVLEHIENDVEVLNQLYAKIKSDGFLVVYVPAFQILYSQFDADIGHYRRYEKKELVTKLQHAGFTVQAAYFGDIIGFFAWLYMKLKRQSLNASEGQGMMFYDRYIFPISRLLDRLGGQYLFGKNLLVYAKKL